jgi:hypothetical protein
VHHDEIGRIFLDGLQPGENGLLPRSAAKDGAGALLREPTGCRSEFGFIVGVNDRNDLADCGMPAERADRVPDKRLASDQAILLGLSAACSLPAASRDDDGCNFHENTRLSGYQSPVLAYQTVIYRFALQQGTCSFATLD